MIHDDDDATLPVEWIFYIGRAKLLLNNRQIGRLKLNEFKRLYQIYKDDFDLETLLRSRGSTYKDLERKQIESEFWL